MSEGSPPGIDLDDSYEALLDRWRRLPVNRQLLGSPDSTLVQIALVLKERSLFRQCGCPVLQISAERARLTGPGPLIEFWGAVGDQKEENWIWRISKAYQALLCDGSRDEPAISLIIDCLCKLGSLDAFSSIASHHLLAVRCADQVFTIVCEQGELKSFDWSRSVDHELASGFLLDVVLPPGLKFSSSDISSLVMGTAHDFEVSPLE